MLENIRGGMVLNSNVNSMISPWVVFKVDWKMIMRYHVVHAVLAMKMISVADTA